MVIDTLQTRTSAMPADMRQGFRLGPFKIEPLRGAVKGPVGKSHHLEPKVMDVFVLLAENATNLVARDDLLDQVWSGQIAADELLTRAISELRRVLGDSRENPGFIETIPKRGYRLIVEPEPVQLATHCSDFASGSAFNRRFGLIVVAIVVSIIIATQIYGWIENNGDIQPGVVSVAVAIYPFDSLSESADYPFLGRTIGEGVLHNLSGRQDIRLLSTAHIAALLDQGVEAGDIATELQATHLLQGTYQISNDNIRWSASLTEKSSGEVVWTEQHDDNVTDILSVQKRIAENIAFGIGSATGLQSPNPHRTVDPEAFRLYADAKERLLEFDLATATELLTKATKIDPTFAEAWADLGQTLIVRSWQVVDPNGPFAKTGEEYALKALEIDPSIQAAYGALALAKSNRHEWVEARAMLNQLLDRSKNSPLDPSAIPALVNFGYGDKALELAERLVAENPYGNGYRILTTFYVGGGNYNKALQAADLAVAHGLSVDSFRLGVAHVELGNIEEAAGHFRLAARERNFNPDLIPKMVAALASDQFSQDLDDALTVEAERNSSFAANLIYWYTFLNYPPDRVFEHATILAEDGRLNHVAFFAAHTQVYRSDPRFLQLMESIGLAEYWRNVEMPTYCTLQNGQLDCGGVISI